MGSDRRRRRAGPDDAVPVRWLFHLHNIRAQSGQLGAGEAGRYQDTEVENPDTGKGM